MSEAAKYLKRAKEKELEKTALTPGQLQAAHILGGSALGAGSGALAGSISARKRKMEYLPGGGDFEARKGHRALKGALIGGGLGALGGLGTGTAANYAVKHEAGLAAAAASKATGAAKPAPASTISPLMGSAEPLRGRPLDISPAASRRPPAPVSAPAPSTRPPSKFQSPGVGPGEFVPLKGWENVGNVGKAASLLEGLLRVHSVI